LIPLGRGRDYAWSLTTGYSDAVDTRAELLCNADGSDPTLDSTGYMFKGKCKEMESRDETFTIKPTAANPGPPGTETRTFYRTDHGPVFQRALVNGKPVAFVKERFFWKKEVDSVPAFYEWNTQIDDIDDFARAAKNFTMSFNAFYADSENIGYWHVGFYPKRVKGQSPSLPTWGTGKWEWKGRRPFEKQPQIYNPKTGWIANWNNKPAQGWSNYDSAKWGSIQRVQLLQDQLHELLDGSGKATLVDLVNVIRQAATQDTRGVYLGPKMLKMAGSAKGDDNYKESLALMTDWVDTGSHRTNIDDNDTMEQGAALAIFDQWYTDLVHGVFDDDIGKDGYDFTMAPITDYTPAHGSSFWFDFSSYLKNIFAGKHMAVDYCDNRETKKTETCQQIAVATLKQAIVDVIKVQGPNPDNWFTPREDIVFQELGYGSVANIPWQNRGTHNHAVEILRDAGPIVQPSPSPSDSGSSSPSPSPSST
jgi:acyl-homoserine lactone acylase PvdQ